MSELKTKPSGKSVKAFLDSVADPAKRQDAFALLALMREETGLDPKLWGDSIVGFGSYKYKYDSGQSGDWFLTGFSPRKQNLTLYIVPGVERYGAQLRKLGKHKIGRSCLYINRLEDVDQALLRDIVRQSVQDLTRKTPSAK
jgi:hypothetical protein